MSRALVISQHKPLAYGLAGATIASSLLGIVGVLGSMFGGLIGIPNTLRYDTWLGRTAVNSVTVGQTGAETGILKGGTGDLGIGPNSANSVLGLYGGSAGAVRTKYAGVDLNGIALAGGATTFQGTNYQGDTWKSTNNGDSLLMKDAAGNTLATLSDLGTTGNFDASGSASIAGGQAMTHYPLSFSLNGQVAAVGATTVTQDGWQSPSVGGSVVVEICYWNGEVVGVGAGTCTTTLRDVTASSNVGSCTYTCNAAVPGEVCSFTGGTITANHNIQLQLIGVAANTTEKGRLNCTAHY